MNISLGIASFTKNLPNFQTEQTVHEWSNWKNVPGSVAMQW